MKKIIASIFLFVSLSALAQKIPAADTIPKNAITEQGKPLGAATAIEVNKDGDSLISADGRLELIIPPGALSKKTDISIQPVKNMLPYANAPAYRLEPSGIQFQKPLQIIFHYDPEESQDSAQLLLAIAMQDDKGQWYGLKKFTLDTIAKTISGFINHFSTWATFDKLKLVNVLQETRIKVNTQQPWGIVGLNWSPEREQQEEEKDKDVGLLRIKWKQPTGVIWRANGVIGGSPEFGILDPYSPDETVAQWNNYTAPALVPDKNPVIISASLLEAFFEINGKEVKDLTLKANTLVYDNAYEVTMICTMLSDAGSEFGKTTYKDTGSFVISLDGKKSKLIETINKNSTAEFDYKGGRCKIKLLRPGKGNIDITGVRTVTIIPATDTKPVIVFIEFTPTRLILPLLKYSCPNRKGGPTVGTTAQGAAMAAGMPALPMMIKFEATDKEQVVELIGKEGEELFYKCTVRKLKDD